MRITEEEIFNRIALNSVPGIGARTAAALITTLGSAKAVLEAPVRVLVRVEGMGATRAKACKNPELFRMAEQEMKFIRDQGIRVLSRGAADYPRRLEQCSDAPLLLYVKGNANLDAPRTLALVGTRKHTEYGQRLCEDLLAGLAHCKDLLVISGLAYGIDTIAHKASLNNQLPTAAVLGHGLHTLYPAANKSLAQDMIRRDGALVTEFSSASNMDRGNFPARNRIVAGLADITVVAESDSKGGALITALMANSYNRDVAAFPGRVYDHKSAGTNMLIRKNLAALINSAEDLLTLMNWDIPAAGPAVQTRLDLQLSREEQLLLDLLAAKDSLHADELLLHSGMNSSELAVTLLQLEMQGLIRSLPGKHYCAN